MRKECGSVSFHGKVVRYRTLSFVCSNESCQSRNAACPPLVNRAVRIDDAPTIGGRRITMTTSMQIPQSDDGHGIQGEIRRFNLDGVDWRVFEYRDPVAAVPKTQLIFMCDGVHRAVDPVPKGWRDMHPEELLRELD
jgi:hypothetical protein